MYHKNNFYRNTYCVFQEVFLEKPIPFHFKSDHQSEYHFTQEGVYRKSNHWGRVGNCRWKLDSNDKLPSQIQRIGFAHWNKFYSNASGALFYVVINQGNQPQMGHVQDGDFKPEYPKRNASECQKCIKEIKMILQDDSWADYLSFDDIELLKVKVLNALVYSKASWTEIRRNLIK